MNPSPPTSSSTEHRNSQMMTCGGKLDSAYELFDGDSLNSTASSWFLDEQTKFFKDQWLTYRTDLLDKHHTDILLILRDANIHLHAAVIVPHSVMLKELLNTSHLQGHSATLHFPEVDSVTVSLMVDLLYTGQSICTLKDFSDLNNLLNSLGLSQLLKSLECIENNIKSEPDFCSGLSSTYKVEAVEDKENDEAVESDEVIFIKEVFSGAYDELFPRKVEAVDNENDKAFESDEVIFIKEVFSGACDKLFPRFNVHNRRSMSASKKWNQALQSFDNFPGNRFTSTKESSKTLVKSKEPKHIKPSFDCNVCKFKFDTKKQLTSHNNAQCSKPKTAKYQEKKFWNSKTNFKNVNGFKSLVKVGKDNTASQIIKVKPQKYAKMRESSIASIRGERKDSKRYLKPLSCRQIIHSRNNIPWAGVDIEDYEDVDRSWVVTKMVMDLKEFEDVTDEEKTFFCAWNEFLWKHKAGVSRVHLETILQEFVDRWGSVVMKNQLYKQFVKHLAWLEQSGLITQQTMLRTVQRIQVMRI